mmetsp:Transcript_2116/g.4615  ORF Transcript_2116/g.4615 Transcript_2116/m.4615 type:complete len:216 (-) Transcript_2116:1897-2544(-)
MHSRSKMGGCWLLRNITPHMNAVNQMLVYWFGWYFRITIACGTGSNPTMVMSLNTSRISISSTTPFFRRHMSSTTGTRCWRRRLHVSRGRARLISPIQDSSGTNRRWTLLVGSAGASPSPSFFSPLPSPPPSAFFSPFSSPPPSGLPVSSTVFTLTAVTSFSALSSASASYSGSSVLGNALLHWYIALGNVRLASLPNESFLLTMAYTKCWLPLY